MNTYETHIGWLRSAKLQGLMNRQEYNLDKMARIARHAMFTTIHQVTGVSVYQSGPEDSSVIRSPEGKSWWRLEANTVPAIGMSALRQAIDGAYKNSFDTYSLIRQDLDVSPQLVDEYATALHVVPPEWTRNDTLWVPEAYQPTA